MAFRGYFALNGVEIANSSRVVAHIGAEVPTNDLGLLEPADDCSLALVAPGSLLGTVSPSQGITGLLSTPPDGTRLYSQGLGVVGDCWDTTNLCFGCKSAIGYDDSWPELPALIGDGIYRPELAPWYTSRIPESGEFGGVWVLDVKGLDTTPVNRDVAEMAGDGGAPSPHRDATRAVTFDALLIACTNAGLTYGLQWLNCRLRDTIARSDSVLRYLAAHPSHSSADPESLVREVHGVVLTQEAQVQDSINTGRGEHHQATMYRVQWKFAVTRPHAYTPPVTVPVDWDTVVVEPIKWVHAANCRKPASCEAMPVLFSETCAPEPIEIVTSPPPTCGGCLPVCAVETRIFEVPTFDWPLRCRDTAVTLNVVNNGTGQLTLKAYWRIANSREQCDDQLWPLQINGLPSEAELVLDAITGRYWVNYAGRKRRPAYIVGTPSGAPWRPPIIDRAKAWEFVVVSDGGASFAMSMSLADRES